MPRTRRRGERGRGSFTAEEQRERRKRREEPLRELCSLCSSAVKGHRTQRPSQLLSHTSPYYFGCSARSDLGRSSFFDCSGGLTFMLSSRPGDTSFGNWPLIERT
jgi:hypothetical protein